MGKNKIISKRILSYLIAAILICMTFPLCGISASFSDIADNKAVETVTGLGLMEGNLDGTFMGEVQISRGEFAHIIANLFTKGDMSAEEWKKKYFTDADGAENSETEFVPDFSASEGVEIFSDVTSSNTYYNDIITVYGLGLMNGVVEGLFDAEASVTLQQAVKVMVNLLGYTPRAAIKGGYPNGYMYTANELKLLNGIDRSQNFNKLQMAQLLYNALEIEMLFLTGIGKTLEYKTYDNVTFLSEILGLYKYEGRLVDNGYTSLTGKSNILPEQIMVDSMVIKNKEAYVCDYIGRNIDVYYDYEENTLSYACLSRTDKVVEIASNDFREFKNNMFTYEKNGKNATVKVDKYAYLIHNGMGKSGYDNSDFKVNKGTIKIIKSSKKDTNDLILFEDYHSFYVDFIDPENKSVYSKATLASDDKKIDFEEKDDKLIVIYDKEGNNQSFDAIKAGNVLSVCQSDCYIKVYISNNKKTEFTVDSIENKNDITVYSGANKYVLSEDYIQMYPDAVPIPGKIYNVYFDVFDEIVKFTENTDGKASVVHIVKCASVGDSLEKTIKCKYYSLEGRMIVNELAERVRILKENDEEVSLTSTDKILEVMGKYNGLAKVAANADGYINYIELPGEQKDMNNTEGRLVRIDIGEPLTDNGILAYYFKQHQGFQGKALVTSAGTKVLEINYPITDINDIRKGNSLPSGVEAPSEESDYQMATISSFKDDDTFYVRAYTTVADSPFAEYVLHYKSVSQNLEKNTSVIGVVQDIYEGVNTLGDVGKIYETYTTNSTTEKLMLSDDFEGTVNLANETQYTDENGNIKAFEVEKGDLVRYSLDGNGRVTKFELVYDENAYNPSSGGRGVLAGTIGEHRGYLGETEYGKYNPMSFSTGDPNPKNGIEWSSGGAARFFSGSPLMVRDTAVKFTSQDLTANGSVYDKDNKAYITESYILGGFMYVKLDGDKVDASMQSAKTLLKPYEVVGNDCNRVVMMVRIGSVTRAVVYDGFLD